MWVLMAIAGAAAGHLTASFIQTFFHRILGHGRRGGWLRSQHVGGHHSIYSGDRLAGPRYSDDGESLSAYYFVAALLIIPVFFVFPQVFAAGFAAGLVLSYFVHIYLHAQYHLHDARFRNQAWFRRLRALHMVHHHRQNRNFAVIDLYWDKLMGTFAGSESADDKEAGCP